MKRRIADCLRWLRSKFSRDLKRSDLVVSIRLFRDSIIFFAILSYFVGWIYINEYLRSFGIFVAHLDIPVHYILVFSYAPLIDAVVNPTWLVARLLLVLVVLIIVCLVAYRRNLVLGYSATLVCSLGVLMIFFILARERAGLHSDEVLEGGGKPIRFAFTKDVKDNPGSVISPLLFGANEEQSGYCLRLVWRTEKDIYVVNAKCDERQRTYRIPVSSFFFSEIFSKPNRGGKK